MATALYDLARAAFAKGLVDWEGGTVKAVLVDTGAYAVNLVADDFLDDVPVGARVATGTVAGRTVSPSGVCDADDVTFSAVTGPSIEALVLYVDGASDATRRLLAYIDNLSGLPTPALTGQDVVVRWSDGANKVFKL